MRTMASSVIITSWSALPMTIPNSRPLERRPIHPGEILREDFLPEYGLSVTALAEAAGVSRQSMNELLRERRALTPEMALRLGKLRYVAGVLAEPAAECGPVGCRSWSQARDRAHSSATSRITIGCTGSYVNSAGVNTAGFFAAGVLSCSGSDLARWGAWVATRSSRWRSCPSAINASTPADASAARFAPLW